MPEHVNTQTRRGLADRLRSTASWRASLAETFPDDQRNCASAKALYEFAVYVDSLPDDDPNLAELSKTGSVAGDVVVTTSDDRAGYYLSRYGFNRPTGADHRRGLIEFVALCQEDDADDQEEDDFTVGFNAGAAWAVETAKKEELADLADVASQGQWCQFAFREGHTLMPTLQAKGLHPDNGVFWLNAHDAWAQGLIFGALEWSTGTDDAA